MISPWTPYGDATLELDNSSSLSSALPTSLKVTTGAAGVVGIKNPGWWGIDVKAANTYKGSFYTRGAYCGNFTASLVSDITNETLATVDIAARSKSDIWTQYNYTLVPTKDAENSNNSFILTFEARAGKTLNFNLISLFPPTYNNRWATLCLCNVDFG